jgi:hypothetical protein
VIASYDPALSSNEQKLRINGKLFQQDCTEDIAAASREPFSIGVRRSDDGGYAIQNYWKGDIQEVVCWETALDASEAAGVEANIMSYHSITNPESQWAVDFDGTNDFMSTGYIVPATSTLTLSCWAKGTTGGGILMSDLGSGGSNSSSRAQLGFYGTTLYVNMGDGTNRYYAYGSDTYDAALTFLDGSWHHIALTINVETQKFYIDGALVHTHDTTDAGTRTGGTSAVLGTAGTEDLIIGRFGSYHGGYWDGSIDEVSIWTQALSASEISNLFNNGRPGLDLRSLEPEAWWKMGDGSPTGIILDEADTGSKALYLPGVASNYASVPDAADLDGFGDFTFEAKGVTFADWTPSAIQGLMSKYKTSTNERAWRLDLQTDGKLYLVLSFLGSDSTGYTSNAANVLSAGATADIMVMRNGTVIRFYVNGVQLGTDLTSVPTTALFNSTENVVIGASYNTTTYPMSGSIERVRIWNSAVANQATPTETPVLDIDFSLPDKFASSFTATSGQTVTINTSGAPPAAIRGATDGALTNGASLTAATKPYKFSSLSCEFDGTNDYMSTSADDTLASKSYSFWAKSDLTTANGVFDHGGASTGSLIFNFSTSRPLLYMAGSYFRYWNDNSAQDDDAWHHWVCYIEHDDISNCKLYCDGVVQSVNSTSASTEANAYTTGLRVGGGSTYFDGSLDEFAIFDGELSADEVKSLYSNKVPEDITSLSPEHWWRMGEGDSGTTITDQGSGGSDGTLTNGAGPGAQDTA